MLKKFKSIPAIPDLIKEPLAWYGIIRIIYGLLKNAGKIKQYLIGIVPGVLVLGVMSPFLWAFYYVGLPSEGGLALLSSRDPFLLMVADTILFAPMVIGLIIMVSLSIMKSLPRK